MKHDAYADLVGQIFPGAVLKAVAPLTGGVSADVYRLELSSAGGERTRVVLRAHGASHSGHSAGLEYALLQALFRRGLPVPEPLHVDVSGSLLEDPFLIMAFVEGSSDIPPTQQGPRFRAMASTLADVHAMPVAGLPELPSRVDPLPEVFDFLPEGQEWQALRNHLRSLNDTAYTGVPKLLHGDYWPENVLWKNDTIAAVLDWEDAALGDSLSDVACSRVELRYRFGKASMGAFTRAYAHYHDVDRHRLALWQVYAAAAAQRYMGQWGLAPDLEAHMRTEALASIREAGAVLMSSSPLD